MADPQLETRLRERRHGRGWSQVELAARAGLSRAAISAIETRRVVPSTAAALALAAALGCAVEDLFALPAGGPPPAEPWAWERPPRERRFWRAAVGGAVLRYPVEATPVGALPHDGLLLNAPPGEFVSAYAGDPARTLVVAGCDPAVGLLAAALARGGGPAIRVLPFVRSSRRALELLRAGKVHVAGVHLGETRGANRRAVAKALGPDYRLVHVARWSEVVALAPGLGLKSLVDVRRAELRWVGRERGSGARRALDALFEGWPAAEARPAIALEARDHRGVAEAIRSGWAQAGVCVRLAAEEAGLEWLALGREPYDLCFAAALEGDPRIAAVLAVLRARAFRELLQELPGYDARRAGELA
ncbi:MAG TPA: substrate-binding domain-containing protein [Longimicrobiales bacterium]|nr:substrate-binding domain-containing protein [Longimicrobiales bacterium]